MSVGPGVKEEPTGGDDLLGYFKLQQLYDHAVTLVPQNYLRHVAGCPELRRGPGMELAPLAGVFASSNRPQIQPLPREVLQRAFTLESGTYELPKVGGL